MKDSIREDIALSSAMICACESIHKFLCQFPAETEFFDFDGKQWCRFHLPLWDANGKLSAKGRGDRGWKKGGAERKIFTAEVHARLHKGISVAAASTFPPTRSDFRGIAFPTNFVFTDITDTLHVNFTDATFDGGANFEGARFDNRADFNGATFGDKANFEGVTFGDGAKFNGATFGNGADFMGVKFGKSSNFKDATFGNRAKFNGATFSGRANFSSVNFQGNVDFSVGKTTDAKSNFQRMNFFKATFVGPCKFDDRILGVDVNFNGAVFHNLVSFHGCTFHPGMSFHRTKFLKTKGKNDNATEKLERSYRTLKLEMEKLRARNEEADFFALEMECRRQRGSVPWLERFAATAYKIFSDYGRSIARPLLWLLPLTFYSFLIYRDLGALHAPAFRDGTEIFEFTLEQMFSPFKVWFAPAEEKVVYNAVQDLLSNYPPLVKILASLQSLATIALLTLFLLALRRRFKMD